MQGVKDGFPICLGYFSVSFGVGILAIKSGLSAWIAVIISATNLTSAGQVAGIGVIAVGGSFIEMVLTQLLINCRYSLMGLSLSQNLSKEFTLIHRMIAAFGITDEIFGVAASKTEPLTPNYMYGLISISTIGWVLGTFLGAVCGEINGCSRNPTIWYVYRNHYSTNSKIKIQLSMYCDGYFYQLYDLLFRKMDFWRICDYYQCCDCRWYYGICCTY